MSNMANPIPGDGGLSQGPSATPAAPVAPLGQTAARGAMWFLTPDRRSRVVLHGFVRRATDGGGPRKDAVVVDVQAAL